MNFALENARVKRYRYAPRHLEDCARIAKRIDDWTGVEPHSVYRDRLRTTHGKKSSFWALVKRADAEP